MTDVIIVEAAISAVDWSGTAGGRHSVREVFLIHI